MKSVKIELLSNEEIEQRGIRDWPIWTKEESKFPWHYDQNEQCLILEGEIIVRSGDEECTITAGDFVTFAQGFDCEWQIVTAVKKHYSFG